MNPFATASNTDALLFWINPEGRFLDANEQACHALGYARQELRTLGVWDVDPGFPRERWLDHWRELRQAKTLHFQTSHRHQDGSLSPAEVFAHYLEFDGHAYNCALAYPLTPLRQTENALRESEERLALALSVSGQGLYDLDLATGRAVFSDEYARMLGYEPSELELTLAAWVSWLHPEDRERVLRLYENCVTDAQPGYQTEFRLRTRPGHWIWVRSVGKVVQRDAAGRPLRMVGTHLDITDRKAAETRLRYHLDLEQALAEISALMIKPGWEDFDARVNWTLERIGRLTQIERSYLFRIGPDGLTMSNTHEWCAQGIHPQRQDGQDLLVADYRPFYDWLQRNEPVSVQTAGLPDGTALKAILEEGNVRAMICVPMRWGDHLRGFIGLDAVTRERDWREEDIRLLRMVTEIIAHTLQHIESDQTVADNARYLENLDRISRILTRRGREIDVINELATAILDIFQADRTYFLHPCDPDAASFRVRMEATRPEWPGLFASQAPIGLEGIEVFLENDFRRDVRQVLSQPGPAIFEFAGASDPVEFIRRSGIQTQMMIALYPQSDQPWLLAVHQCAHARHWTGLEQRLFQAIAERVSDALSGHLLLQQLQASEERLRLVIEATSDAVWDWNPQTGEIFFSDRWYRMLDYAPGELAANSASWLDRIHPDDLPLMEAIFWRHLNGSLPEFSIEYRMRAKGGDWKWINSRGKVIERDAAGKPLRMVGTNVDITPRKRTEQALRLAQLSITRSADAMFWITPQGRFINVNDQACESLGYGRDELLSMAVWDIDPDLPQESWSPHWERTRQLKKRRFETRHRRKEGAIFPVEISANYVEHEGQEYDFAFVRDITERKRAEQALRASEAFLEAIIEYSPLSMWVADERGTLMRMNQACRDLLRVTDGDLVGKYNLFEDNIVARQGVMPLVRRVFEQGESVRFLLHYDISQLQSLRLKEAIQVVLEVTISPVLDARKRVVNAIIQHVDITNRARAEEELRRYREHLEELVTERTTALQQANTELRQVMGQLVQAEKLAALGNLVAGVAHELNTPLGNARMVASTLSEHFQTFSAALDAGTLRRSQLTEFLQRGREAADLLERNTVRAADLIGHFKQIAVDQTSMRRRRFNLGQTVEEVLATLRPTFKHTAHRIEVTIAPDLELDSYPGPLEQVIVNLVSNSLTHGFAGVATGGIEISAHPFGPTQLALRYADNGIGIPDTLQARIFEPFFTTRLGHGGSGLGLYIVYNLVTGVLGGTVAVNSQPGQGATFTITLPRTAPDGQTTGLFS